MAADTNTGEPKTGEPETAAVAAAEPKAAGRKAAGQKAAAKTSRPEAGQLRITQVKSKIGGNSAQRDTLRSLGLHRIGETVVRADRPEVRGMIRVVRHLVTVEEVH